MVLAPMGSFLRALSRLASYDRGPPGPKAQVSPPPMVSPPVSVPQPIRASSLRRDTRGGGPVDSEGGVGECKGWWGSGTAVVMLLFYKVR